MAKLKFHNGTGWEEVAPAVHGDEGHSKSYAEQTGTYANLRAQATTAADVGLGNVANVAQMPLAGGTFTGPAVAQTNTAYTTAQLRNVILSTADPSGGNNGDIWVKYTP